MKFTWMAFALAVMLVSGVEAYAHHSFAASYDENGTIEIEGELVQFFFRNPHSWVHVIAPNENGELVRYGVEWGGAGQLTGGGVTRFTLRPGDHVIISGSPGRNPADHIIRMESIRRTSDDFAWGFEGEYFD